MTSKNSNLVNAFSEISNGPNVILLSTAISAPAVHQEIAAHPAVGSSNYNQNR